MTFLGDAMIACEKDTPEESKGFFHLHSPYALFLIVVKSLAGMLGFLDLSTNL